MVDADNIKLFRTDAKEMNFLYEDPLMADAIK